LGEALAQFRDEDFPETEPNSAKFYRRKLMTVPSLPKLGTPPAPPPLRKIALEEHFGHPSVFMHDRDGRDGTRREEAASMSCFVHVQRIARVM
jgi:hypothetical protein